MKIYLAGPDVFRIDAIDRGKLLKELCNFYGHIGLYPLDNEVSGSCTFQMSKEIYEANFNMIKDCDVILANIERFRGPSADPGTVWEIGAGKALGKKVILYNSDDLQYNEFVNRDVKETKFPNVEDFGLIDNLMIVHCADSIHLNLKHALEYLNEI